MTSVTVNQFVNRYCCDACASSKKRARDDDVNSVNSAKKTIKKEIVPGFDEKVGLNFLIQNVFGLCQVVKSDNFSWQNHPQAAPLLMNIGDDFYKLGLIRTEPTKPYIVNLINSWKRTELVLICRVFF